MSLCPYGMAAEQNILPLVKLFAGQVEMAAAETAAGKDLARRYDIQVFSAYIFATEFARGLRFERVRHMVIDRLCRQPQQNPASGGQVRLAGKCPLRQRGSAVPANLRRGG